MESLFEILLRLSISISLFFVLYWLLLRKSTHFKANRYFLIFSLLISLLAAIFPVQYDVLVENTSKTKLLDLSGAFQNSGIDDPVLLEESEGFLWQQALLITYLSGIVFFLLRLFIQTWKPIQIILKTKPKNINNQLIVENNQFSLPFSFFNRIFINPKYHKQEELTDILAHEKVHIRERHWIDLLIIELLTVVVWFNPFIWLFERTIKQNHEYLADEGVLTRGHSPVRYQALLINQLMGMQVVGLTNNLNFALGPTRLKMMTKQKTPRRKLIRMAWAFPMIAMILFAFAKPVYKYNEVSKSDQMITEKPELMKISQEIKIHGIVVDESGEPLPGAAIVIKGGTVGTVADMQGKFELDTPGEGTILVTSFVGFKSQENKLNAKTKEIKVQMHKALIEIGTREIFTDDEMTPPPPPPPTPELKGDDSKDVFYIVEEMPYYQYGHYGLIQYSRKKLQELKSQAEFSGGKLKGKATIGFTVNAKGEVTNIQVLEKNNDVAAKAALAIVSGMENWSPGKQRGKAVSVNYAMPFEF